MFLRAELGVVAPALQVALELAGDRLAARLREIDGVACLLELVDVVGNLIVLRCQLIDAGLPGARLLGEVAERHRDVEQVLDPPNERQGCLRAGRLGDIVGDRRPQ